MASLWDYCGCGRVPTTTVTSMRCLSRNRRGLGFVRWLQLAGDGHGPRAAPHCERQAVLLHGAPAIDDAAAPQHRARESLPDCDERGRTEPPVADARRNGSTAASRVCTGSSRTRDASRAHKRCSTSPEVHASADEERARHGLRNPKARWLDEREAHVWTGTHYSRRSQSSSSSS